MKKIIWKSDYSITLAIKLDADIGNLTKKTVRGIPKPLKFLEPEPDTENLIENGERTPNRNHRRLEFKNQAGIVI